jgi:crossover junction endodeoxyribonuclease RuvC
MTATPAVSAPGLCAVGFDPGLAETGFAALAGGRGVPVVLGTGVIRTHAADPLDVRLERLFEGTHEVLTSFAPDVVVIEDVFSTPAVPRTAILMGHAGVITWRTSAEAGGP